MLDKPALRDETIAACLREAFGVTATRITFLPLGHDNLAWVYRVDAADRAAYFLKVRRPPANALSLALPRYLQDSGFEQVVAPLRTDAGALWSPVADYILMLYPFIEARTGMQGGLSSPQWEAFGAILRQLHATTLPPALARAVPRERFISTPRLLDIVRALLDGQHDADLSNEPAREMAAFVRAERAELGRMLRRLDELGGMLRGRRVARVLCHADLHLNNVLVDAHEQLWIVDWDQPLCAPPERDLLCVLGPAMCGVMPGSPEHAAFYRGYGAYAIDPALLAYFRYERALTDLGENAELVLRMPDRSDATRREAAQRITSMFAPGKQVDAAQRVDEQVIARSSTAR
jgi:spectinomycin phosphotransferase